MRPDPNTHLKVLTHMSPEYEARIAYVSWVCARCKKDMSKYHGNYMVDERKPPEVSIVCEKCFRASDGIEISE